MNARAVSVIGSGPFVFFHVKSVDIPPNEWYNIKRRKEVNEVGQKKKRRDEAMMKMALAAALLDLITKLVEFAGKLLER